MKHTDAISEKQDRMDGVSVWKCIIQTHHLLASVILATEHPKSLSQYQCIC